MSKKISQREQNGEIERRGKEKKEYRRERERRV